MTFPRADQEWEVHGMIVYLVFPRTFHGISSDLV